jgi:hypothetical protein
VDASVGHDAAPGNEAVTVFLDRQRSENVVENPALDTIE